MTTTRWEYRIEVMNLLDDHGTAASEPAAAALGLLGRDGWEVVGVSPSRASSHGLRVETTQHVLLLKRAAAGGREH